MAPVPVSTRRERFMLAADGCLITAGTFALMMGAAFGLDALGVVPLGEPHSSGLSAVLSWLSWLLQVGAYVVGPVLVWALYGRHLSVGAILGALVGFLVTGAAVMVMLLPAVLLELVVGLFTTSEFAGPLAYLILISAALLTLAVWLDVNAFRDLARTPRAHTGLDIARFTATAGVIVFGVVMVAVTWPTVDPEAWAFLLIGGVQGAVVVTLADVGVRMADARASGSAPAGI